MRDLIVTAPEQLRGQLAALATEERVRLAARFRPGELAGTAAGTKAAMTELLRESRAILREAR